ncbi:low molecular weight phosphatase family protein [bacterium]|nr:low molecular weight phosphatase family protein [bacterium]
MKIAFVCTENMCRSQMAEALAKNLFPEHVFVSAGTHPADSMDEGALNMLEEEGIHWEGKPKSLNRINRPDILVSMGCDVACPIIPGVKVVQWDIADPKGKEIEIYRRTADLLKEKIRQLVSKYINITP